MKLNRHYRTVNRLAIIIQMCMERGWLGVFCRCWLPVLLRGVVLMAAQSTATTTAAAEPRNHFNIHSK